MKKLIEQLSQAAQEFLMDKHVRTFAQCFLRIPDRLVVVPDTKSDIKSEVLALLESMYVHFCEKPETAQLALESLLLTLAEVRGANLWRS